MTTVHSTSSCEKLHINDDEVAQRTETHAYPIYSPIAEDDPSCNTSSSSSTSYLKLPQNLHVVSTSELTQDADLLHLQNFAHYLKRKKSSKEKKDKIFMSLEDYYENFDSERAKKLIDSLFLPRNEICAKCARFDDSPVYSDRYVYKKLPLLAKEAKITQVSNTSVIFRTSGEDIDFMPVYELTKSNASGIFYNVCFAPDMMDLKSSLEPNIILLKNSYSFSSKHKSKFQTFHKVVDKGYNRISERGIIEPIFSPSKIKDVKFDFKVDIEQEKESQILLKKTAKEEDLNDLEQGKESLLSLEPLLQTSLETTNIKIKKDWFTDSEHLKLINIITTYFLTFIFLLSITFYLVYFS